MQPTFTLGIEEEFQIVDRATRELRSHIQMIMDDQGMLLREFIKEEMHQSVVEAGTGICQDIQQARREVTALRSELARLAISKDLRIAAASTHPFSHWKDQLITPNPRYKNIIEDLQIVARSNLIFGLHVHVGIDDKDILIQIVNEMRYFLPHLLALTSNSPFWIGRNTGLKSYRSKVFDKFPRTNIPDEFSSWAEFEGFVNLLIKTNCLDNGKKIWWDVRPHAFFNTLEVRVCDLPMRVDETIAVAALIQALVAKLYSLRARNLGWRRYRRDLIMENKWRAIRYGIDGKLLDLGKMTEVPTRDLIYELLAFVDDVVDDLGSRDELKHIEWILEHGSGADRQLEVYKQSNDLKTVVDYIVHETHRGLDLGENAGAILPVTLAGSSDDYDD